MENIDPAHDEAQTLRDLSEFEANPVAALFALTDYYDENGVLQGVVPAHLIKFLAMRLKLFTEHRPPYSLDQAFGGAIKRRRNHIITDRIRRDIWYEVTFDRFVGVLPKYYARSLAEKYGVSESRVKGEISRVIKEENEESSRKAIPFSELKER